MTQGKTRVPAVEDWFTMDENHPHLLGTRCSQCATVYFPPEKGFCRHPECSSQSFEQVELSSEGKLWSYTNNCYAPPAPYVAKDPYEPFAIAAVALETEGMVVLGQVVEGVSVEELQVGQRMKLTLSVLFEDDERLVMVWKWKPVPGGN
jgi:uncharacterized protein